jgi:hemerythrin-like domain-containing protein
MDARVRMAGPVEPGAGFEQPFEMLEACHERVHRMLDLLQRLREHLILHGADEQARQAARDVMRYFDVAAPEHHRDEELHVFPALVAQGDPETVAVVGRLRDDHQRMDAGWRDARRVLAALADGEVRAPGASDEAALDDFAGLYAGHIEAEEEIAYPAARAAMGPEPLAAMSRDMMQRRGLKTD